MSDFVQTFKANFFDISAHHFEEKAFQLFHFQAKNNPIYAEYLHHLGIKISHITRLENIPFLPIEFFKNHAVRSVFSAPQMVFQSSGTTAQITSKHYISDVHFYHRNAEFIFEQFYGKLSDFEILALLPSYLERSNSSLVEMVQFFISQSGKNSGFYLHNLDELAKKLTFLTQKARPILLIGVTFALLDFAEKYPLDLSHVILMETGGMKGKRPEMTREAVHQVLRKSFGCQVVHSEYGMTELLSQAYSGGEGLFALPPQMRIFLREPNDPFCLEHQRKNGGINVIDLANIESCAFIETQDLGRFEMNGFRVLGRFDNSDVRGCNLMTAL